ncbi:hypothetical protein AA313_de0201070 [Arthrobotrys entomopaga]|nr:hypothetical protein AA313_de0201070 [Arthrobotrys entomopaga]
MLFTFAITISSSLLYRRHKSDAESFLVGYVYNFLAVVVIPSVVARVVNREVKDRDVTWICRSITGGGVFGVLGREGSEEVFRCRRVEEDMTKGLRNSKFVKKELYVPKSLFITII